MNTGATLFLVIIFAVIIFMYGTQIQDYVNNLTNQVAQTQANAAIKTQPKDGQNICTLNVNFNPALSGTVLPHTPNIKLINGANKISWIGCQGSIVANSLVPMWDQFLFNDNPLAFISDIKGSYSFNAILVADDGTQLTPIVNPVIVNFQNIFTITDQSFNVSFTFLHVPRQHYVLQLSSQSLGINQDTVGNIYYQQINP